MAARLNLAGIAFVAGSLVFAFVPFNFSNEAALAGALALVAVGVALGLAGIVRREMLLGLVAVGLGLLLALYYVVLYRHPN